MASCALVFGGSGTVGSAVVRALSATETPCHFTYFRSPEKAAQLTAECRQSIAHSVDLRDPAAIRALFRSFDADGVLPRLFVHCAAISQPRQLAQISDGDWDEVVAVGCRSALIACQELQPRLGKAGGDIVLVGALDRGQSLPLPVHFAAAQGMLGTMAMALAKELGPANIRVNLLALGPLESGLSQQLPPAAISDFKAYSALRRLGTANEVARAVLWLGQRNTFMTGKVLSVNGGL